jgi:hypothetical protein
MQAMILVSHTGKSETLYSTYEEEKKIRANPVSYGSAILSKVFGSLQ